ncbi:MAG: hypothetical protein EOO04_37140 [Chitinophagaceae bacterium]|nr:MAG: hypothetical protein EOO04_37140 [Chitinophagaceae bacterium]
MNQDQIIFQTKVAGGVKIKTGKQVNVSRLLRLIITSALAGLLFWLSMLKLPAHYSWVLAGSAILLSIVFSMADWSGYHHLTLTAEDLSVVQSKKKTYRVPLSEVQFLDYYTPSDDPENNRQNDANLVIFTNDGQLYMNLKNLGRKKTMHLLNAIYRLGFQVNMINEDLQFQYSKYFQPDLPAS